MDRELEVRDDEHASDFDISLIGYNFFSSESDIVLFPDNEDCESSSNIVELAPRIARTHSQNVKALNDEFEKKLDSWINKIVLSTAVGGRLCQNSGCNSTAEFICFSCQSLSAFCKIHARNHFELLRCEATVHSITFKHVIMSDTGCSSSAPEKDTSFDSDDDPVPEETIEETGESPKMLYFGISGWYKAEKPSSIEDLMEKNFFPSSPKRPKAGFHINLLEMCRSLYTVGHLSFQGIWTVLQDFWKSNSPGDFYGSFTVTLRQFMRAKHLIDNFRISLMDSEIIGPGRTKCLCCSPVRGGHMNGKAIFVADGNFSLKKYSGHSTSISASLLKSSYFLDGTPPGVVLPDSKTYCSNFRSGDDISKGNSLCDINGIYLSACSHAIPHSVQDIIKGENLGYGIKFLETLKAEYGKFYNSNVVFGYDIICLLDSHLRKRNLGHLLPDKIFTPEMHARSHIESCQISTAPYNHLGFGRVDGEFVERIWSEIRKFISHTTTMRTENREESICHLLEGLARSKMANIVQTLKHEYKSSLKVITAFEGFGITAWGYDETRVRLRNYREMKARNLICPDSQDSQDIYNGILEYVREIIRNDKSIYNGVGTQLVANLKRTNTNLRGKIGALLTEYNQRMSLNLTEADVFRKVEENTRLNDANLDRNVKYWKAKEQLVLTVSSLERLIQNIEDIKGPDIAQMADIHYQKSWSDLFNRRIHQMSNISIDAKNLLNEIINNPFYEKIDF